MPPLSPSDPLERVFGTLELRVLDHLWSRGAAATVRDLAPDFAGVAYTTLMTTLDRLHRKGVLARVKSGRRFVYEPRLTREHLLSSVAGDALAAILGPRATDLRPVVSFFVDAVRREDKDVLDALDALIREHGRPEEQS
ncbi:MAG: BlaI/MecI/CopY family transcriptional regulator [Vicinamibacterales bacterium]